MKELALYHCSAAGSSGGLAHHPLSPPAVREGAANAALFVLFLSSSVLARPFCQMEIKAALRAKKDIVFVLDEDPAHGGAPLDELIAEGRAFSANAAQAAAGKVHLEPADFDVLFPGGRPAHPIVPFRRGTALLETTVPALLTHIAAARGAPALVPPSHPRLKLSPAATLPRADGCHVLIAASALGTHQALFLQTALTARARGVRFVVRTLPPGSSAADGAAAAASAVLVVVLLTTDLWAAGEPLDAGVCGVVRAALSGRGGRRLMALHEWDARHGGVYPISPLIDSAPPSLRSLFDDFVAAPFERTRDKRALMLRDVLAAAGAQAVGESGPFAVPAPPPFFRCVRRWGWGGPRTICLAPPPRSAAPTRARPPPRRSGGRCCSTTWTASRRTRRAASLRGATAAAASPRSQRLSCATAQSWVAGWGEGTGGDCSGARVPRVTCLAAAAAGGGLRRRALDHRRARGGARGAARRPPGASNDGRGRAAGRCYRPPPLAGAPRRAAGERLRRQRGGGRRRVRFRLDPLCRADRRRDAPVARAARAARARVPRRPPRRRRPEPRRGGPL